MQKLPNLASCSFSQLRKGSHQVVYLEYGLALRNAKYGEW
jgi:hypothetical protein